jgi:hypothetical protein
MSFDPQNPLEASLVRASADPAHRPQFYRDLLDADIFIIQPAPAEPRDGAGRAVVPEGESIGIAAMEREGKPRLPIFSSLPRLQAALTGPASYLRLGARAFLEMTAGADLVLNPGSEYGKEITAAEAAAMVDGSIWRPTESYVAERETQVMLGQPARYPDALVQALTRLFRTRPQVERAWLAHFHNPARPEPPHTLIGVELSGDPGEVFGEAGVVAGNVPVPDPPVDFIRFADDGGIGNYFKETQPFYVRAGQS